MTRDKRDWANPKIEFTDADGSAIRVLSFDLELPPRIKALMERILSNEELSRAQRFRHAQDRARFIVSHAVVRTILGHYVGIEPDALQFHFGPCGKPALARSTGGGRVCFNVSRSGSLCIIAIHPSLELGVDVERLRRLPGADSIARRFFSDPEYRMLQSVRNEGRHEAFLNCWTRKEAIVKALGQGLTFPLSAFAVSLIPGEPASVLYMRGEPQAADRWTLYSLTPAKGYIAALATKATRRRVICRHLSRRDTEQMITARRGCHLSTTR